MASSQISIQMPRNIVPVRMGASWNGVIKTLVLPYDGSYLEGRLIQGEPMENLWHQVSNTEMKAYLTVCHLF